MIQGEIPHRVAKKGKWVGKRNFTHDSASIAFPGAWTGLEGKPQKKLRI